jgi:hypothetical protein
LDEIAKEKQRIGEALARADVQREKLTGQLSELEATERVLARYSKGTQTKKAAAAKTPTVTTKAVPVRSRGRRRPPTEKPAGGKRSSSSLGDQVLALATGKTQQEITAACKGARRTMSALPFRGASGLAASRSATGRSMRRSRLGRSNAPRSDTRTRRLAAAAAHWRRRMVILLIVSALTGCSVATDTPTSAPVSGPAASGSPSLSAPSVVGAGSFPRSFLIPGTDTSIRIGGS